jgi:hypothetical protein
LADRAERAPDRLRTAVQREGLLRALVEQDSAVAAPSVRITAAVSRMRRRLEI